MLKKVITGWNAAPGAPKNWTPERGECGALPIRVFADKDGNVLCCESAWEPTADELAHLNAGGSVILRVAGWQPPVNLYTEPYSEAYPTMPDTPETAPPSQRSPTPLPLVIQQPDQITLSVFIESLTRCLDSFRLDWVGRRASDPDAHPRTQSIGQWLASYRAFLEKTQDTDDCG